MLFLVISDPKPQRPTSVAADRQDLWTWIQPLVDTGHVRSMHAKVGRGAAVMFSVDDNETLHRDLNEWADIIPAHFDIHPMIEPSKAKEHLALQRARA